MICFAGSHQPKQRPRGLRRRTRRLFVTLVIELVARTVLAPAAILILDRDEPIHLAPCIGRCGIDARCVEGAERGPRSVDIIHAPAAEPAAVLLLLAQD